METGVLRELGLTEGEIKAYLTLLRLGSSAAGAVARESGISRSKIYLVLDKLEKKGMASHVEQRGVKYFQPVEPSKIRDYLKERKEKLENLEGDLERFLPRLEAFHKGAGAGQTVSVYLGFKGMRVAHEHVYLKLRRGDEYYALGAPSGRSWKGMERYWEKDHQRRAASAIKCKILFNADVDRSVLEDRNGRPLCEARYMPIGMVTPAEIEVFGDTTLIITISDEPVTVEIVSREISRSFKSYFDQFWKRSKSFR